MISRNTLVRIVDDDESVCGSLSFMLRIAGFDVTTYTSARDFLDKDDRERPGCVILDVRMSGMSGLEVHQEMIRRQSLLSVIFLTGHGEVQMAVQALHDGAVDFLLKPAQPEKLLDAVRKAIEINERKLQRRMELEEVRRQIGQLTRSELEVAQLISKGFTTQMISLALGISEQTVKVYRSHIYKKWGIVNAVEISRVVDEYNRDIAPERHA
ncbi:MAG TPA: DNA-binding response regulator [Sutterella sp.]|jgi:FixJ family two-component response regulator|nr:DNA-binding response regulator [Sutterella sp.]